MALINHNEHKELEELQKVEARIRRGERRERIHRLLIGGLALLTVAAFFTGHCTAGHCRKR